MSQRFHVTPKGQVRQCKAVGGGCPYGAEDHADSREAAEKRRDEKMRVEHGSGLAGVRKSLDMTEKTSIEKTPVNYGRCGWAEATGTKEVFEKNSFKTEVRDDRQNVKFKIESPEDAQKILSSVQHYVLDRYDDGPTMLNLLESVQKHPGKIKAVGSLVSDFSEDNEKVHPDGLEFTDPEDIKKLDDGIRMIRYSHYKNFEDRERMIDHVNETVVAPVLEKYGIHARTEPHQWIRTSSGSIRMWWDD